MLGTIGFLLLVAHYAADYLFQGDRMATLKSGPGWQGWRANLLHVATHVAVTAVLLGTARAALDLDIAPWPAALAIAWIGFSHGLIDRRWPVAWWMRNTGSAAFLESGAGAPLVDQALHITVGLLPAAFALAAL
ncbi:DUF3307 domain-containing protein [Kitasatospora sp. CB02891]|uniref:DUF3307 domain-containing protein n=1 Tax=Kitasatospora sp. CB02891 TaxID=2020329 RepID=UPI000C276405|nr:DUF3307 domain-containing protein [Kitasatospora sp. CB02891]PJN22410.1 hypothetical protein CG736_28265 [Kitasatospora sp. CB02891]